VLSQGVPSASSHSRGLPSADRPKSTGLQGLYIGNGAIFIIDGDGDSSISSTMSSSFCWTSGGRDRRCRRTSPALDADSVVPHTTACRCQSRDDHSVGEETPHSRSPSRSISLFPTRRCGILDLVEQDDDRCWSAGVLVEEFKAKFLRAVLSKSIWMMCWRRI